MKLIPGAKKVGECCLIARDFYLLSRLISKYFILFNVIINGIVSIISLSDSSLLVYRSATDF